MPSENTIQRIIEFAGRHDGIDIEVLKDGLELWGLHREVQRLVENDLAGWGLTPRQVEIMESIYHQTESVMTPADLSDEVGLTRSAMTGALDSLEKFGYVIRGQHPTDRRMVVISLTPSGREFIAEHLVERYRKLFRTMDVLSKKERQLLMKSYRKVIDLLEGEAVRGAHNTQ